MSKPAAEAVATTTTRATKTSSGGIVKLKAKFLLLFFNLMHPKDVWGESFSIFYSITCCYLDESSGSNSSHVYGVENNSKTILKNSLVVAVVVNCSCTRRALPSYRKSAQVQMLIDIKKKYFSINLFSTSSSPFLWSLLGPEVGRKVNFIERKLICFASDWRVNKCGF